MDAAIHIEGLSKKYGTAEALAPLHLEVKKGEILGYLGPNGAGKTTTLRLLLGLIRPTTGSATIFGQDCQTQKIETHRRLAYIPGEATLWPSLTGAETLHLLGKLQGRVDEKYRDALIARFKLDPHKKVRAYSKGNRQKLNVIAGFMSRAELLMLDEPTSGLDPLMEQAFRECVLEAKQHGQTVLLSSHVLGEVEALCDRVAILRAGKLVEVGTLAEMRHLSALTVEATFASSPPDVSKLKDVSDVKVTGHQLTCQVHGSIDRLLSTLAAAHPKTLLSREPSLEELFLSLYGEEETTKGRHER
ncbi:MAG TPA: ABC transporter ATP-binding protein [Candidatus Saccharimonadales bacterium]|nr:ABC transporter ATP-binding protein [Candidatus Saccharimonadales bacterium]